MSNLKFVSRGNGSVGKSRIYLLYHEEDFEAHVRPLMEQILALQDCLIFYRDPKSNETDALDEPTIRRFQLMIVLVTESLLLRPQEHFADELQLAEQCNVPMLPILTDTGLLDLYTQCFENIQFLARDNHDPTAIPYEKKLADYLQGILTDDDLTRRISRAFRAHLFISYRKKDRQHAQRFMRLIHQDESLRDMAFWYDEYLVPGEDFSLSIQEALRRCDIFALIITPNLVNEDNYVRSTEYPMAQACQRDHILAAELQPTARSQLSQLYPGLPEIISPTESEKLHRVMNDLLPSGTGSKMKRPADAQEAPPENNEMDADERDFLRGLAYLTGTEVETDAAYGLSLLRAVADRGYRPAIRKLVYVYRFGQGTAIDHGEALSWMKKLTETADWSAVPDIEERLRDFKELGNYQMELGLYGEAGHTFEACWTHMPYGLERALMAASLSGIQRQLGETGEALEYARYCMDCASSYPDENLAEKQLLLCMGSERLGDVLLDMGQPKQAFTFHRDAYALACTQFTTNGYYDPETIILQLGKLTEDMLQLGDLEKAELYIALQREKIDDLQKYRPTWQTKRLSWQNLDCQKTLLTRQDRIDEALAISQQLICDREEAASVNESPEDLYQLAREYREHYQLSQKSTQPPLVPVLLKAYKIISLLVQDRPDVYNYQYERNELEKLLKKAPLLPR